MYRKGTMQPQLDVTARQERLTVRKQCCTLMMTMHVCFCVTKQLSGPDKSFAFRLSNNIQHEGQNYPVIMDVTPGPCRRKLRGGESLAWQQHEWL